MSKIIFWLGILLCPFLVSCSETKTGNVKEIIESYYNKGNFNGAVLVAKENCIVYDTLLGYSDFDRKINLRKPASFYIASLSKPFTAIGIMLLQQEGLLLYDDKANEYVAGLPVYAQNITIRQLLTHTSGIKDYENILSGRRGLTNKDVVEWLHEQDSLRFEPGSRFEYSNSGYIILSLIIESISKQSYSCFLQSNVFTPLNMHHTKVYDDTNPFIENRVTGFDKNKMPDDYSILTTGDGGIYSTVEDLYKLDRALKDNLLLSSENTALMYQLPLLSGGQESEYGFGWFVESSDDDKIAKHTGGLNGFRSLFWRDLKNDITIIALTNQGDAFPVNNFLNDLKRTLK